MTRWVADAARPRRAAPLHRLPPRLEDARHRRRRPPATLTRARAIARGNGLRYVYTGNVHDEAGGATFCPGCGAVVIGRDGYELTRWHLTGDGHCESCGATIPGRFERRPGRWGSRRLPVRLADFAA